MLEISDLPQPSFLNTDYSCNTSKLRNCGEKIGDGGGRRIWIVSLILHLTHTITYTNISQTTFLFCILGTDGQLWLDTAPIRQRVRAGDTTVLGCTVENLGNSVVSKQSLLAPFLEHIYHLFKTTSEIFQPLVSTLHWRLNLMWDGLWDCIYSIQFNLFIDSPNMLAYNHVT